MSRHRPILPVALLLFLSACSTTPEAADEPGFDSPKEVLERTLEYAEAGRWGDLLDLVAPADRDLATMQLVSTTHIAEAFYSGTTRQEDLDDIAKRHGLDLESKENEALMKSMKVSLDDARAKLAKLFEGIDKRALL